MAEKEDFITYKGYPLARSGKTIYFGNSYDPFIVMMQIATTQKVNDVELADKILVQLFNTDPNVPPQNRIANRIERRGMYAAMETAAVWLQRANAPKTPDAKK